MEHQEKKFKTSTTGAQETKTIVKNNSGCINLNTEWNSKTTTLHQKPIPKYPYTYVEEELSNDESKKQ
jgi:hypothetical protein